MSKKYLLLSLITFLLLGCASVQPKDTTMREPALALFKVKASGKYFAGIGFSIFGDEVFKLLLRNKETGVVYQGQILGNNYYAVPNIPMGEYEIEEADTGFRKPIIGTMVKLFFNENKISISVLKPDVNYFGSFIIKTKQDGLSFLIDQLAYVPPREYDYPEIEKVFNQENPDAGWRFSRVE